MPELGPRPRDIPAYPDRVYREEGWTTWPDFFGVAYRMTRARQHVPLLEARDIALRLGIANSTQFEKWRRGRRPDIRPLPEGLPTHPDRSYCEAGWTNWTEFLDPDGTGPVMPFRQARDVARRLGLADIRNWVEFVQDGEGRGMRLPARPDLAYLRSDWKGWPDWLGLEKARASTAED